MKPPFIAQLRYVKRLDEQWHVNYTKVLQQFDGTVWNDVDADGAQWETPEQEKKHNKARDKEYIFR
jgi:hypothetical protein